MPNQRKKGLTQAHAWVREDVRDWLQDLADKKGVVISDVIRELFDKEMKRDQEESEKAGA